MAIKSAAHPRLRIFDAHSHYHDHVHPTMTPADALRRARKAGLSGMLLSSWVGDGTSEIHKLAPRFVVPGLAVYQDDSIIHPKDRYTWMNNPEVPTLIARRLAKGDLPYKVIGEFHCFFDTGITPVMRKVAELAVRHGLALHVHGHRNVVAKWLEEFPTLKILWAHGGYVCYGRCPGNVPWPHENPTADEVGAMLAKYPNLYTELSVREGNTVVSITVQDGPNKGKLLPEWRALLLAHPDRVMLGTDPHSQDRWDNLKGIADEMRGWLKDVPLSIAKRVARRNAERLFKLR